MALSGSYYTNVGSHWGLKLTWSATQNIAGNYSTVTANLYWIAEDSYGAVSSSATKDGSITVDGASTTFSGAGLASLSANQTKLLKSWTHQVNHNADGTKSLSLSAYFDAEVTLSGTYYGRITVSGSATLDTIPRASSLTAGQSWTAGNDTTFSISRASTSFTHTIKISVNGTLIKTLTGLATSASSAFSVTDNKNIFTQLAQGASKGTSIVLETYSGSTLIGSKTYTGTVTAPNASTSTHADFNIGATVSGVISSNNSHFTHIVEYYAGGSYYRFADGVGAGTWSYDTSAIETGLYSKTPNSNTLSGELHIYTYYEGVLVRSMVTYTVNAKVTNSNPQFTASGIRCYDTVQSVIAMTGDSKYIVQGVSIPNVSIAVANKAVAINSATMQSYIVTLNGIQKSASYSSTTDLYFGFPAVNTGADLTLSVKAVDSRGNSTEVTVAVPVIPYESPKVISSAKRINNFESDTTLKLSGTISPVTIGGVQKNAVTLMQYRYKDKATTTWGAWTNFTYTTSAESYTATDVILTLDNMEAWDIELNIVDKLSGTDITISVGTGQPVFFVDSLKRSIGINKFPIYDNAMEVGGNLSSSGTMYADGGLQVTGNVDVLNGAVKSQQYYGKYNSTMRILEDFMNGNTAINALGGNLYLGQSNTANIYLTSDIISLVTWGKIIGEDGKIYGQIDNEAFIAPSLLNGFYNYGGGFGTVGYFKDKNGIVHIKGLVSGGSTGTDIFTLPTGYRPSGNLIFMQLANNAIARIDVQSDGSVYYSSGQSGVFLTLSGISFRAEA